jgi:hypothetical protein
MDDDEQSALAHQQELNERYEDDWQKDYDQWLNRELAWWKWIDNDPNWIKENS